MKKEGDVMKKVLLDIFLLKAFLRIVKNHARLLVVSFMAFFTVQAHALSAFDALTSAVNFTDLIAALSIIYAGMIVVGLFMMGAEIVTHRLGWKTR